MTGSFWHRLDLAARRSTPTALTVLLVLVNALPLHAPGMARVVPVLPLMAIYHWAVFRPELMPAYAVFLIGVLHDVLWGTPLGVSALVFLAVQGTVAAQRRFLVGKTFMIVWLGFVLVAAGAAVLAWILVSLFHFAVVDARAALVQYLMTVGTFPLISGLFLRWQRRLLQAE